MKPNYRRIKLPSHPRAGKAGYVLEHVIVAEAALGKYLSPEHPVHHHNTDKSDNSNTNLVICENQEYHHLLHRRMRALAICGNADWRVCGLCRAYGDPETMYINGYRALHLPCKYAYHKARNYYRKPGVPRKSYRRKKQGGESE